MKRQVFLFVTHFYSDEIRQTFIHFMKSVDERGPCFILYHQRVGETVPTGILNLPHYIIDEKHLLDLGYYQPKFSLVPGSNHFCLLRFAREYDYDFYWHIEYDVRFSGTWSNFFDYFSESDDDFLSSHIRRYAQEPEWFWWTHIIHAHAYEHIPKDKCLRSFNPVYRVSRNAVQYIDKMHQAGWYGHHEVLFPTLLHHKGLKIRDFGGTGNFVSLEDKNKFYIDSAGSDLSDGTMRFGNSHVFLWNKPKDKLIHPVKPGRKRQFIHKIAGSLLARAQSQTGLFEDKSCRRESVNPISICTLVMNGFDFTKKFISSVKSNKRFPYELVIVDNGSDLETSAYLEAQTSNYYKFTGNQGFCKGFNKAVTMCRNEYILLTNNDTLWPDENWGRELIHEFETLRNCGLLFPCTNNILLPANKRHKKGRRVMKLPRWRWPLCSGVAVFTKRSIFESVGGFSSDDFWVSGEDLDLQCKIWDAGYDIYVTEKVFVEHIGKATSSTLPDREKIWEQSFLKFKQKWGHRLRQLE